MHKDPPDHLVTQLDELGLCNPRQFRAVQGRVRRLTRDLPAFDRVWLDALVQARRITPFQADRFSDEKGPGIKVGSYVLMFPLGSSDLGTTYHARCVDNHNTVSIIGRWGHTSTGAGPTPSWKTFHPSAAGAAASSSKPLEISGRPQQTRGAISTRAERRWARCAAARRCVGS